MSTSTTPTTLLQAVNLLLRAVGIAQVSSLEPADTSTEVQEAVQHLSDTSVAVQTEGWNFNTEEDFPLSPQDDTGEILLPTNTVSFAPNFRHREMRLTERGGRLYSKADHTFNIGEPIEGRLVLLLPFEDIPQAVRWAIVTRAGNEFGTNRAPDVNTYKFTKAVADKAWETALDYDQEARDETLPEASPHFAYMQRGRVPRSGGPLEGYQSTRLPLSTGGGGLPSTITVVADGGEVE